MRPAEETGGRRRQICDRCGLNFTEGFHWPGLGIPVVLCKDCTDDIEESVWSYARDERDARRRFLERLRSLGMSS